LIGSNGDLNTSINLNIKIKNKSEGENFNTPFNAHIHYSENFRKKLTYLYSLIFPNSNQRPTFCFIFIILITYIHTRLTICIIENLSLLIKMTASFLGMTILSWGGNVGDAINASVAAKLNSADLLTTSILGAQIMNIQLCLGLPWILSMIKNYFSYNKPTLIDFANKNPLNFVLPLFLVVLASIFILTIFKMNLNKKSGVCLIIIYIFYIVYEYKNNLK